MGLLKKIFGGQQQVPVKVNQRRSPRVQLSHLHHIFFVPDNSFQPICLRNISMSGMALVPGGEHAFSWDQELQGQLSIDKQALLVKAHLRHMSETMAGFEFTEASPQLKQMIESYLRTEILALTLYAVNPAFMKADPRGRSSWFSDSQNNELYCIWDSEGVIEFHISFHGNYVEGGRDRPVRGGQISEDPQERGNYGHKASSMLPHLGDMEPEMLRLASIFTQNVMGLPADLRGNIVALLGE